MKKKNYDKRFIMWIDEDLYNEIKKDADLKRISVAQAIRIKLRRHYEKPARY